MILVTLGTQKQKFYRLLDAIEKINTKEKIVVQAGWSADYKSDKMEIFDFISYDEMEKYIDEASLIITHGGTGSIVMPLQHNKKVIAAPRLEKYGEHVNDHQTEIVNVFSDEGHILAFNDGDDLQEIYDKSKKFKPVPYKSNTEQFVKELDKEINQKNDKIRFWPSAVLLFLIFLLISLWVPYCGDDWTNNILGLDSIVDYFRVAYQKYLDVEGRFFSRIFVLIFTHYKFLWAIINALMISGIFVLINKIIKNKNNKFIRFLTFTLFVFISNEILRQVIVWPTGSATYMFPMFLTIIFLYFNNNIWENDYKISNLKFIVSLIMIMIVSMSIETVSVAMVFITLFIFVYVFWKTKKFDIKRFICFLISLIGFILMRVSPGATLRLADTGFSNIGFIDMMKTSIPKFVEYTYLTNIVLIILMVFVCYLLLKNNKVKYLFVKMLALGVIPLLTVIMSAYKFCRLYLGFEVNILNKGLFLVNSSNVVIIIYWLFFTFAFIYLIYRYINESNKIKILFYTFIGYLANAAMLFSPIWGGRTTSFTVVMLFIVCMLIINNYKADLFNNTLFKRSLVIITVLWILCMLILYYNVYLQNKNRELTIEKQIAENSKTVTLELLPEYALHTANAWNNWHQSMLKAYYGIDDDVQLNRKVVKYRYNLFYK